MATEGAAAGAAAVAVAGAGAAAAKAQRLGGAAGAPPSSGRKRARELLDEQLALLEQRPNNYRPWTAEVRRAGAFLVLCVVAGAAVR